MRQPLLILCSEFPPGPGGIGEHARCLANELSQHGFSVTVVSELRSHFGPPVTDVPFIVQYVHGGRWQKAAGMLIQARQWAARNPTGWLVCSGMLPVWLMPLIRLFSGLHTVAILHGHEVLMGGYLKRWWQVYSLRQFHVRVAVSEFCRLTAREVLKAPIHLIPNGFDPHKYGEGPTTGHHEVLRLVTVGRVSPRKGQHNVVKALPRIKAKFPDVEYHVIGVPDFAEELEALAFQLGVREHIKIHGVLDNGDTRIRLAASDIFIMLSERQPDGDVEGFGIAILEANYLGLPAIGARGCGIEQAIWHQHSGWLVDPQNQLEIVTAIEDIRMQYRRYQAQAREWAGRFTWYEMGRQYATLFMNA